MEDIHLSHITIDDVTLSPYKKYDLKVDVLRLDKIHELISGNKWFKLRYHVEEAKKLSKSTILTYGGAWSNHILATAAISAAEQLKCIGVIRGEEPTQFSPTLQKARELGMQLEFVSRDEYKNQKNGNNSIDEAMYVIPEGGYSVLGAKGAASIADFCDYNSYSHICCACGTGTMVAGLINATSAPQEIIGISVLKNNKALEEDVRALLVNEDANYQFFHDYHFGGYAKYTDELIGFMNQFYEQTGVPSDFVYTGKLYYAIDDLITKQFFPAGSRLLLIHSGGLQGNQSLNNGTLIF